MIKLKSSFIRGAKYNPQTRQLTIYIGKRSYDLKAVPAPRYQALLKAKSKGKYFNKHLKGKYL